MADISMCDNKKCKIKKTCYRHEAKANKWRQSYLMITKEVKDKKDCDNFWNLESITKGTI